MNVFVISRNPELYSTRRLVEAGEKRGHQFFVRDPLKFTVHVSAQLGLYYHSRKISIPDAVIPRIGASITFFGLSVVRQFEHLKVFSLNDSQGIACSRDKLRALQVLNYHGIPHPQTAVVRRKSEIIKAIEEIGGAPVVIKLIEGTQGVGVVLAEDLGTAQTIMELLQFAKQNVLVQQFIKEARGQDIRAFVVGDRVVASMRRIAAHGDFRSNVHRGGRAEAIDLPPAYAQMAVRSAQLVGLQVAGVDLIESRNGPMVLEVNSSPGLEGIERATGVDVATEIVQYLESKVSCEARS
jgi:ribosomal protein S6--L-glutamate ligase